MQAAIDRVIRTFTLMHPAPTSELTNDRLDAGRDEPTAFAARLLENYKIQLAQRGVKND